MFAVAHVHHSLLFELQLLDVTQLGIFSVRLESLLVS